MIKRIDTDALKSWNRDRLEELDGEVNVSYYHGYESAIDNVADWLDEQPDTEVHGHWEDISETAIPLPGMMTPITNTAETCSVCKVRVGFVGPKRYLSDKQCPNCGAFMDEIV